MAPQTPSSTIRTKTTTPLPDSDWSARHHAISFRQMIALEFHTNNDDNTSNPDSTTLTSLSAGFTSTPNNPKTFTSLSAGFPPTPAPRTYGGHVFAQTGWAASHTVPYGMVLHSMTGYFLEIGDTRYPFRYVVRVVRTGGIYAIRHVEVFQDAGEATKGSGKPVLCFVAYVGFKRDESEKHAGSSGADGKGKKAQRRTFEHQALPRDYLKREYGGLLGKKAFEQWPVVQGMDGLWSNEMSVEEWKQRGDAYPGLEMKKVDMRGYNPRIVPAGGVMGGDGGDAARRWRLLQLYRLVEDERDAKLGAETEKKMKTGADDVFNLHACAHLYASDRNSLFLAQRALGFQDVRGQMGSLSHTVNFHGYAKELVMVDERTGKPKEFVQEMWISDSGADRATYNSRLFEKESGRIIATSVQDGMMRIPTGRTKEIIDGDAIVRRDMKL